MAGAFIELPAVAAKAVPRMHRKRVHGNPTTVTVKIGDRVEISGLRIGSPKNHPEPGPMSLSPRFGHRIFVLSEYIHTSSSSRELFPLDPGIH